VANIEEGHISTASRIVTHLAMQTARPLVYAPKSGVVVGEGEAMELLCRPYRAPWRHPGAA